MAGTVLVSVEGIPGGPRDEILATVLHDAVRAEFHGSTFAHSVRELLARSKAWTGCALGPRVVSLGPWLDLVPTDALLADTYRRLASRVLPRDAVHVMVRVHSDPHEAFDRVLGCGAEGKDVDLRAMATAASRVRFLDSALLGLPTRVIDVFAPPHATDTPSDLASLVAKVKDGVAAAAAAASA
jgi:hypothetical protein